MGSCQGGRKKGADLPLLDPKLDGLSDDQLLIMVASPKCSNLAKSKSQASLEKIRQTPRQSPKSAITSPRSDGRLAPPDSIRDAASFYLPSPLPGSPHLGDVESRGAVTSPVHVFSTVDSTLCAVETFHSDTCPLPSDALRSRAGINSGISDCGDSALLTEDGSPECISLHQHLDFDEEGRKLLEAVEQGRLGDYNSYDIIYTHPVSGARLYLANEKTAKCREDLERLGVTHIVRCLDYDGTQGVCEGEEKYAYLHFPIGWWKDTSNARSDKGIAQLFAPLLGFVSDAMVGGSNVLIHCLAGVHRAGTAGIACVLFFCHLDRNSGTCAVQAARPSAEAISGLNALLRKLDHAQRADMLDLAIQAARHQGYQKAVIAVFGKPRKRR